MPDPEFDEAIREASRRIGQIFTEENERQRQEVHARLRTVLELARTRVGGELAEALLNVLLVADKWHTDPQWQFLAAHDAADQVLTAMETGLGVRTR